MTDRYIHIVLPEPHYTLFDTMRSDLPEIIVVNDALLGFQHIEVFAWHLEITIDAKFLAENGMPTTEESATLFDVGDRIEKEIIGDNALFLSRSTWNGIRVLSFRIYDPEVAHAVLQRLLAEKPIIREWAYCMEQDIEWKLAAYIFKLFPLAKGFDA